MSQEKATFDYHEETQSEKLARKSKESPFMVIGTYCYLNIECITSKLLLAMGNNFGSV